MEKPDRLTDGTEAKSGPPNLKEWQDFFARFVIRLIVDAYLYVVLGDLIEELSPMEAKQISLSKEEMLEIAAPLATMANKSSFARKHGRSIIATADSYESILSLLFWMRRVNRIAKKHRPAQPPRQTRRQRQMRRQTNRQAQQAQQPVTGTVIPSTAQNGTDSNAFDDGYSSGEVNGTPLPSFGVFNPGGG